MATVEVPGSKSLTNRLLILAALADAPSHISGALRSRDTDLMIQALRSLGVGITEGQAASSLHISPVPTGQPLQGNIHIDTGLAGTVMRFMPAVAALAQGPVHFDGDAQARLRPMGPVLAALHMLGVDISNTEDAGSQDTRQAFSPATSQGCAISPPSGLPLALPFTVHGTGHVLGGHVDVDASASSQFVSGLLLAAARFDTGLTLRHVGNTLPSLPHIAMTVDCLRQVGVEVDDSRPGIWVVAPGPIRARDVRVEPDLSNALPFVGAALIVGGSVRIPGWPLPSIAKDVPSRMSDASQESRGSHAVRAGAVSDASKPADASAASSPLGTTQPGGLVPSILEQMGAQTALSADGVLTVVGTGRIRGIDIDLGPAGELAPNIAALAALATSPSRLRGIGHLRGHETDRLAALTREINRLGGQCEETRDGLVITPRPLHGGVFHTYQDHRMATSGAMLGLATPGVEVEDIGTTAKTLPGFDRMWAAMLHPDGPAPAVGQPAKAQPGTVQPNKGQPNKGAGQPAKGQPATIQPSKAQPAKGQ